MFCVKFVFKKGEREREKEREREGEKSGLVQKALQPWFAILDSTQNILSRLYLKSFFVRILV